MRSFQHKCFVFFVLSAVILLTLGILFMLLWFDPITSFPAPDKGLSVPANILFFGLPLPSSSSNPNSPESENRRHLEKSPQSNLIRSGRGVKVKVIPLKLKVKVKVKSNPSQILSLAPPPAQVPTPVTTTLRTGKRGKFSLKLLFLWESR